MGRFDWQNISLIDVYKYGIGLLGLSLDEVMEMDVISFVPLVEGNLLMEDERRDDLADTLMPFHAKNAAMIVASSGNMGSNFDPMELASALYPKEEIWGTVFAEDSPKTYKESKNTLIETFNINEDEIK